MKALYLLVKFLAFKGPVNKNFNVEKISYVEKFIVFSVKAKVYCPKFQQSFLVY